MCFILILFLISLFLHDPTINFNGLLLSLHFWIITHALCTSKNQVISLIRSTFDAIISCANTNLFSLIEVNGSNFFGIFYFINCKLRFPGFLKILDFNKIIFYINIIILWFSFFHFLIWRIGFNNTNIILKDKKFFTTEK